MSLSQTWILHQCVRSQKIQPEYGNIRQTRNVRDFNPVECCSALLRLIDFFDCRTYSSAFLFRVKRLAQTTWPWYSLLWGSCISLQCLVSHCSNIEDLALFPGQKSARVLSYGGKQLISREVDLEKMRRTEARLRADTNVTKERPRSNPVVPNHLQKLQPKNVSSVVVSTIPFGTFSVE